MDVKVEISGVSITLTKEQLEQIERQIAKKPAIFVPVKGEPYYYFNSDGTMRASSWDGCAIDIGRASFGTAYKTKEEAEKAKGIQLAKVRLKNAIAEANEGWTPDWSSTSECKYFFSYRAGIVDIDSNSILKHKPTWMYMKSRAIANEILKHFHSDIELIVKE